MKKEAMRKFKRFIKDILRWIKFSIFKDGIFLVEMKDCITEFGDTYREKDKHFFVKSLAYHNDKEKMKEILNSFYENNQIKCFEDVVGEKIYHEAGKMYFVPWEDNAVRPLSRFLNSHKVGPITPEGLELVIKRLLRVYKAINTEGFKQLRLFTSIPRVLKLIGSDGKERYLVKDGQHRFSVAAYLGIEKVWVTYQSVYDFGDPEESVIRVSEARNWPMVKNGIVTEEQAKNILTMFFGRFNKWLVH